MKNILVTGGAGYIGSVLCGQLLEAGYNVTVIDNLSRNIQPLAGYCESEAFSFVNGDVRDEAVMRQLVSKADAIVALAALVSPKICARDTALAESVNFHSIVMLNRLRSKSQPLLFPNTNIGYGTKSKAPLYDEDSPMEPNSHYGITKIAAENNIRERGEYIVLRLASIFGPSPAMKSHLLLNYYLHKAVTEKQIIVYQADYRRNFLHVQDICRCFLYGLNNYNSMKNEVYNVGLDEANITKRELAELIKRFIPSLFLHYAEIGSDPDGRDYLVSNEKIRKKGFVPQIGLQRGIRDLIKYYAMLPQVDD